MLSRRSSTRLQHTFSAFKRGFHSSKKRNHTVEVESTEDRDGTVVTTQIKKGPPGPNDKLIFHMAEAYLPKIQDPLADSDESRPTTKKHLRHEPKNGASEGKNGLARPESGQDSFFFTELDAGAKRGSIALGVADGVGGWSSVGVDPADFAHSLCECMTEKFKTQEAQLDDDIEPLLPPLTVLSHAYERLKEEQRVVAGSCTACVGVASPVSGILQVANLGDSGYSIFRQGRLYRQSKPLLHTFNTPYQMAIIPDSLKIQNSQRIDDKPSDATLSTHTLHHGDVVVFATDGLIDNLFAHEILNIVTDTMTRTSSWTYNKATGEIEPSDNMTGASELASALVKHAALYSMDTQRQTPFTQELKRHVNVTTYGGKPDDVTVVCLLVQKAH
jgi:protein phosphatase PTC7